MEIENKIEKNVALAPLTTYKIGGPAKYFIEVKSKEDLMDSFLWCRGKKKKYVILAGGSNVLVSDKGFDGLVIKLNNNDILLDLRPVIFLYSQNNQI